MADNLTAEQRSYSMSQIRSKQNRSTELRLIELMRGAGVKGWRRNSRLEGRPDFVFPRERVAVFVDGCYWHGCRCRGSGPKSNLEYWTAKFERNRRRDRAVSAALRTAGWRVLRIWEHALKRSPGSCVRRLRAALHPAG